MNFQEHDVQHDDHDDTLAVLGIQPSGWVATQPVVARHVEQTLLQAARIAHYALDNPSEKAVMQLFQTMIDRTSFHNAYLANAPGDVH